MRQKIQANKYDKMQFPSSDYLCSLQNIYIERNRAKNREKIFLSILTLSLELTNCRIYLPVPIYIYALQLIGIIVLKFNSSQ